MRKRKLVQIGNVLYGLVYFAELDENGKDKNDPNLDLNYYLDHFDVRLLKEK
jgi:hypothetical protein